MDSETRGKINEILNDWFEKGKFLETANWILKADAEQVQSEEDLVLGYFLGLSMDTATDCMVYAKWLKKSKKRHQKRLEKLLGKEEARKAQEEEERLRGDYREKGGRPLKLSLTEKEWDDIRSTLLLWVRPFREKIRKERALRGLHT